MYLNMSSTGLYMCDRDDHQDSIIESYAEEDVTTYQERISSDLTNMLARSRITLQLTWIRCDNVPGTGCKSLEEHVTTYEEHLASHLNKSLQRIRNVLQVTDK